VINPIKEVDPIMAIIMIETEMMMTGIKNQHNDQHMMITLHTLKKLKNLK